MASAKRRRTYAPKQRFVIAKLDDSTVLAGWCVPIKNRNIARRVENLKPATREIVKLSPAFATIGEQEFAAALGVQFGIGIKLQD